MVPLSHGEWLAANVKGARATRFDDEGHLSIVQRKLPEMLDQLTALAGGRW